MEALAPFFQQRSACFRAVPKPLTVFVHGLLISAYHGTHLFGRQTQSNSGIVLSYCVKYRDWHKPPVFRAWSNSFNGLPTVHSKVWFCSTKWEQKNLKQFIMLFVTRLTRYPLQFISYLGVVQAIFLHFSMPPPFPLSHRLARCWLNSCLQPWRRNITENCFIMLKLVNKERVENQFKSQGTPGEGLHISPPRIKSIAARPHRWSHSLMRDISVQFFFNSRSAPHHSLLLDISLFFCYEFICISTASAYIFNGILAPDPLLRWYITIKLQLREM